jgi:deoxyribodipyrimidine photolyase-related protein
MVYLVYPHQLYFDFYPKGATLYLVEELLFFTQYKFHRQKLIFHRASMKAFADGFQGNIRYVDFSELSTTGAIVDRLLRDGVTECELVNPDDDWLLSRLLSASQGRVKISLLASPHFLTSSETIQSFETSRDFFYFHEFYISRRKALNILVTDNQPLGGKWSFDSENRIKIPKTLVPPAIPKTSSNRFIEEAKSYVLRYFPDNPGSIELYNYPCTREAALSRLGVFFKERYVNFGQYEDSISSKYVHNFHSVLTPFLNVGLLSPAEIVAEALRHDAPLNSKEGFIRQIIGWREFVRLIYHRIGRKQRSANALNNRQNIPDSFYTGTTGVTPVDVVIKRVHDHAYCHHIERLMVLGNFMLLCDINPDEVYRWFMELFIDAYDWVMVPNVYGMSQYADGGMMTTKPYVSGSAYVLKMSDFRKDSWCPIWDALYWRFINKHQEMIRLNPRLAVMAGMCDRLNASGKLAEHQQIADTYLEKLHG